MLSQDCQNRCRLSVPMDRSVASVGCQKASKRPITGVVPSVMRHFINPARQQIQTHSHRDLEAHALHLMMARAPPPVPGQTQNFFFWDGPRFPPHDAFRVFISLIERQWRQSMCKERDVVRVPISAPTMTSGMIEYAYGSFSSKSCNQKAG